MKVTLQLPYKGYLVNPPSPIRYITYGVYGGFFVEVERLFFHHSLLPYLPSGDARDRVRQLQMKG